MIILSNFLDFSLTLKVCYGRSRLRDKLTLNNVRQRSQSQPYFLFVYGHPVQDIQCSHDPFGEESKASCSAYSNTARVVEY